MLIIRLVIMLLFQLIKLNVMQVHEEMDLNWLND